MESRGDVQICPQEDIPPHVLDRAIDWLVKLQSGAMGHDVRRGCESWRAADPLHERAWQRLQEVERQFRHPPEIPPALARMTLERAERDRDRQRFRRKTFTALGFGFLAVALSWLTVAQLPGRFMPTDYTTATGARDVVRLEDGTELVLNTGSAVDVEFTPAQRLVLLRRGEIMITTGHDAGQRPFRVQTGQASFEALGTRFIVRQEDRHTRLSVQEGIVAMHPAHGGRTTLAQAGQEFLIGDAGQQQVSDDGFDSAAWVDGALVAKQMRLGDFVAELSRYRRGWLRCDADAADLRVSGVFQLDDTDRALEALARSLPLKIERRTRYWLVVTRQQESKDRM